MAGGGGVFHVEFGINETELTRSLEEQRYAHAKRLIQANSFTSYLDEGCYQRTPLFISLCGKDAQGRLFPRNLYLARLLTQCGASVNYRVPTTYFGCEYMGPGKSGLELVVSLYNRVTLAPCHTPGVNRQECGDHEVNQMQVIGLDQEPVTSKQELLQQLLDLTFVMLTHGGDLEMRNVNQQTALHRTAVFSADPRMLHMLCENSLNLNLLDAKGNTPLGALCDPFPLGVDHFLQTSPVDPYTFHCHLRHGKHTFLHYLLSLDKLQVDHENNAGRTALFHAMVGGDSHSALCLLQHGADASLRGQVRDHQGATRRISPLFASLFSSRAITSHRDKYVANQRPRLHWIAHLVTAGYFSHPSIVSELRELLTSDFPHFLHLHLHLGGQRLLHLLFGGATVSLAQTAASCVFHNVFLRRKSPSKSALFGGKLADDNRTLEDFEHPDKFYLYIEEWVTLEVVEQARRSLELSGNVLLYLQVELLRWRMAARFRQFAWFKYHDEELDGEMDADSTDLSSDENDSDLEYW